jgi:hypothetical protein
MCSYISAALITTNFIYLFQFHFNFSFMSKIIMVKDFFTVPTLPTFYIFYINNSYNFLKANRSRSNLQR